MRPSTLQHWKISEILISLFVFLVISFYTFTLLFLVPSPGFSYNINTGRIVAIYAQVQEGEPALQLNDALVQIGPVVWENFTKDRRILLFEGVQAGETVEITVERNGETLLIPWKFTGLNPTTLNPRLLNIWVLSFFFFYFGAIAIALIRPRDILRNLFIAINYLTAIWLIFGMLSSSHLLGSSLLLRAFTWLLLPVYLHFHWLFPRPLKPLSKNFVIFAYLICLCFTVAELFQVLHSSLYVLPFLLALLGSFIIQVIHYAKHKDQRHEIRLLAIAIAIAFVPPIVFGILIAVGSAPNIFALGLFALPFMPLAYFYVIYRRSMGGLEIRLNRIISLYLFLILFVIALFIIAILFLNSNLPDETLIVMRIIIVLGLVFAAVTTFPTFQNFIERRFLGINLDSQTLVQNFSNLIVSNTKMESLLQMLEKDVFPSLLIRQYAIAQVENHQLSPLLMKNVTQVQLPEKEAILNLHDMEGKFIPNLPPTDNWLRLILPLKFDNSTLGFFLLGSRDPDDIYHQQEIPILQSIANQTAIALSNIAQAKTLREMYKSGLERYEQERLRLGRDLHDSVLNELSDLYIKLGENTSSDIQTSYKEVISRLREIASNLRPPALISGLTPAIHALAENVMQKTDDKIKVIVDLETTDERMPENIEVHLFRILQEACQNSLRHAQASVIKISGSLSAQKADLYIEDDGIGFAMDDTWDLNEILENRHFGLIGMFERAHVINAKLNIEPKPHTKIHVLWVAEKFKLYIGA